LFRKIIEIGLDNYFKMLDGTRKLEYDKLQTLICVGGEIRSKICP
jgi:hypothetical protein